MSLSNLSGSTDAASSAFAVNSETNAARPHQAGQFVDRRRAQSQDPNRPERRQFGSSHSGLSEAGRELAFAIDQYKVQNHRRYLTCDEMLRVLADLGYAKQDSTLT